MQQLAIKIESDVLRIVLLWYTSSYKLMPVSTRIDSPSLSCVFSKSSFGSDRLPSTVYPKLISLN